MVNRLKDEKSLYLRQHRDNPVDWWPWGDAALLRAQKEDKLILLSIGYSACHWCHVMAHECFEDLYIARLMNEHFICVKVDREEYPDLDLIGMDVVQMITQRGGWPLHVFCLPDGRPFFAGTYFPPTDRGQGIIPWPQLLMRIVGHYKQSKADLVENAVNIAKNLEWSNTPPGVDEKAFGEEDLKKAAQSICETHDHLCGGFGGAPKFPSPMILSFLLDSRLHFDQGGINRDNHYLNTIDNVIRTTLSAMAYGGIYDQIGGGFYRYTVDAAWRIPHFEKMLSDNALLIEIYARAWALYRDPLYRAIVEETVSWVIRDLSSENPGFATSYDADSEGREGHYYLWSKKEICSILGQEQGLEFCDAYGIACEDDFRVSTCCVEERSCCEDKPCCEERSCCEALEGVPKDKERCVEQGCNGDDRGSPGRDCCGVQDYGNQNIIGSNPVLLSKDFKQRAAFKEMREKLLGERNKRVRPNVDDKRILSWNSLIAKSLIVAGDAIGKREWIEQGKRILDWIGESMNRSQGELHAIVYGEDGFGTAYLNDYAFYAEACLSLYRLGSSKPSEHWVDYRDRAEKVIQKVMRDFRDEQAMGYFFTKQSSSKGFRKKEWFDQAIPSGNSSLIHSFVELYDLTQRDSYAQEYVSMKRAYHGLVQRAGNSVSYALSAFLKWKNVLNRKK